MNEHLPSTHERVNLSVANQLGQTIVGHEVASRPMTLEAGANPNDLAKMLDYAIQYGSDTDVEALFDAGMHIDQGDYEDRTALMIKTAQGRKDVVERLLNRGANVNAVQWYQNRIPFTALDAARQTGRSEIATILEGQGAKSGRDLNLERPR